MSSPSAPRAVRLIELGEDGAPTYKGLLMVEAGTRLVFTMRPTPHVDMVRTPKHFTPLRVPPATFPLLSPAPLSPAPHSPALTLTPYTTPL
jgi:hypothetical protein